MNQFQSYPCFRGMRIHHLRLLIQCASEASYRAGEIIFKAGEPIAACFLIKSGTVALRIKPLMENRVDKTFRSGEAVGWGCLAQGSMWAFQGQALTETRVTTLDGKRLLAAVEQHPDFGRELFARTAQHDVVDGTELLKIIIAPLGFSSVQLGGETATENSSNFMSDTLDLSPNCAKQLAVRDGQWVQLQDGQRRAVIPIRIKAVNEVAGEHNSSVRIGGDLIISRAPRDQAGFAGVCDI